MGNAFRYIMIGLIGVNAGLWSKNIFPTDISTRVIEADSLPRIQRVYREKARKETLVENPDSAGQYISLKDYLRSNFDTKEERNLRKAEIEYRVAQHEGGNQ